MKHPRNFTRNLFLAGIATMALPALLIWAKPAGLPNWAPPLTHGDVKANSPSAVVLGLGAAANSSDGVAIGSNAIATGHQAIAQGTPNETVAIGGSAVAQGWRCTAIGAKAKAGVVSATAIGRGAYAWGPHMIAIGRGAYMEQVRTSPYLNQGNACGIAGDSLFLGGRMAHCLIDRTGDSEVIPKANGGDGKARWNVRTHRPSNYTIHGMDAYDARFTEDPEQFDASKYDPKDSKTWINRPDIDVRGGDVTLAAGRGSGVAPGGDLIFQTAPAGTVSQNNKNPLHDVMKLDTDDKTPHATAMWLWDNDTKQVKRVMVGGPDSGGKGFRALVIEN